MQLGICWQWLVGYIVSRLVTRTSAVRAVYITSPLSVYLLPKVVEHQLQTASTMHVKYFDAKREGRVTNEDAIPKLKTHFSLL